MTNLLTTLSNHCVKLRRGDTRQSTSRSAEGIPLDPSVIRAGWSAGCPRSHIKLPLLAIAFAFMVFSLIYFECQTWANPNDPVSEFPIKTEGAVSQGQDGEPNFRLQLSNPSALPRRVGVRWNVTDWVGVSLGEGTFEQELPSKSSINFSKGVRSTDCGHYLARWKVEDAETGAVLSFSDSASFHMPGELRWTRSLNGQWEIASPQDPGKAPENGWSPTKVPRIFDGGDNHCYWLRRSFDIPEKLSGDRLKVRFGAVNFEATVYCNGKLSGHHFGGFTPFEVDITDAAEFGKENQILIYITDWTAACIFQTKRRGPDYHADLGMYPGGLIAPIGERYFEMGIWLDVDLAALPPVYVADAFIKTSVKNKRLETGVKIRNEDKAAREVRLEASVRDGNGIVRKLSPVNVRLEPGRKQPPRSLNPGKTLNFGSSIIRTSMNSRPHWWMPLQIAGLTHPLKDSGSGNSVPMALTSH